jgi:hypothetical protein
MLQSNIDRDLLSELMKASAMALTGINQSLAQGRLEKTIPNFVSVAMHSLDLIGQHVDVHVPGEQECMQIVSEIGQLQELYSRS